MHALSRKVRITLAMAIALGLTAFFARHESPETRSLRDATVHSGRFELWTPLRGSVQPVDTVSVRSPFDGSATITWLIEDGEPVLAGDPLLRFDPSALEERLIGLERDLRLARAEHASLVEARQPLELQELEMERGLVRAEWTEQTELLADTEELINEGLLSDREARSLRERVLELARKNAGLSNQWQLTATRLHPLARERSLARMEAAERALQFAEAQVSNCVVRAERNGIVRRLPVYLGSERRVLRIGDIVFKNQAILEIADLRRFDLRSSVEEGFLSRVQVGMPVVVQVPAFPGLVMEAQVRSVGLYPDSRSGHFPVVIELRQHDDRLRPGLGVHCRVLSLREEHALQIPRLAVDWQNGRPSARVLLADGSVVERSLETGMANAEDIVVHSGLREGERVLLP